MKNLVKEYVRILQIRNEAAHTHDFLRRDQQNAELDYLRAQIELVRIQIGMSLEQVQAMMQQARRDQAELPVETIPEKFAWIRLLTEAIDRKQVNRTHTTVQRLSTQYAQVCVN